MLPVHPQGLGTGGRLLLTRQTYPAVMLSAYKDRSHGQWKTAFAVFAARTIPLFYHIFGALYSFCGREFCGIRCTCKKQCGCQTDCCSFPEPILFCIVKFPPCCFLCFLKTERCVFIITEERKIHKCFLHTFRALFDHLPTRLHRCIS